jgi:multicomponent Na+:H+ antiporter subunit D
MYSVLELFDPRTQLAVVILCALPLVSSALNLIAKVGRLRLFLFISFALWFGGTLWALYSSFAAIAETGAIAYPVGGFEEPLGIVLELNRGGWTAAATLFILASAVWLFALGSRETGAFFLSILSLMLFSLMGIICTRDLFNLFVFFEILSLCSLLFISHDRSRESLLAALRYLLISSVSIFIYLIAVWMIYRRSGALSFASVGTVGEGLAHAVAIAALYAGILTRTAVLPFHTWLPRAHAAAPHPASALLSGFVVTAPVLALLHIDALSPYPHMEGLLIPLGLVTAAAGSLLALLEHDAKRLLAFFTISHMGLVVAAFAVDTAGAETAVLYGVTGHALYKGLLFLTVGEVTHREGCRDIRRLRGIQRLYPLYGLLFLIGALGHLGLPPFAGFEGKKLISEALAAHPLSPLITIAGFFGAAALLRLALIFTGKKGPGPGEKRSRTGGFFPAAGLTLLAVASLAYGLCAGPAEELYRSGELLTAIEGGGGAVLSEILRSICGFEAIAAGLTWADALKSTGTVAAAALGLFLLARARRAGRVLRSRGSVRLSRLRSHLRPRLHSLFRPFVRPDLRPRLRLGEPGLQTSLRLLTAGTLLFLLYGLFL